MGSNKIILSITIYCDETVKKRGIHKEQIERTSKKLVLNRGKGRTDFTRQFLPCCRSDGDEGSGEVEYRCFHSH